MTVVTLNLPKEQKMEMSMFHTFKVRNFEVYA